MKDWQVDVIKTGMYGTRLKDFFAVFLGTLVELLNQNQIEYSRSGLYAWATWAKRVRVTRGSYGEVLVAKSTITQDTLFLDVVHKSVCELPPIVYREFRKVISVRPTLSIFMDTKFGTIFKNKLKENNLSLAEFFWCLIKMCGNDKEVKKLDGIYKRRMGRQKVNTDDFIGVPGSNFIAGAIQDLQKQIAVANKEFLDKKNVLYSETWKKYENDVSAMRSEMEAKIASLKEEIKSLVESEFENSFEENKVGA